MIPSTMKAAVLTRFGSPENITVKDVPTPKIKAGQVLVKVHASSVNSGDARIRGKNVPKGYGLLVSLVFGFRKPRFPIMGMSFAGEIVTTGADVTSYTVGDRIYGSTGITLGAHAEYIALKATADITNLPDDVSFETAATLSFGGKTAQFFLKQKANLKSGETILINGASGAVGLSMIQLAKHMGAKVTAVCSEPNHDLVRKFGADNVVDYRTTDIAKLDQKFDVIADCVGTAPYARMRNCLNNGGRLLMVVGTMGQALAAPLQSLFTPHKVMGGTAEASPEDLNWLVDMHNQGHMTQTVDASFPLADIALAHTRVDTGRKRGMVVVTMPVLDATRTAAKAG